VNQRTDLPPADECIDRPTSVGRNAAFAQRQIINNAAESICGTSSEEIVRARLAFHKAISRPVLRSTSRPAGCVLSDASEMSFELVYATSIYRPLLYRFSNFNWNE